MSLRVKNQTDVTQKILCLDDGDEIIIQPRAESKIDDKYKDFIDKSKVKILDGKIKKVKRKNKFESKPQNTGKNTQNKNQNTQNFEGNQEIDQTSTGEKIDSSKSLDK